MYKSPYCLVSEWRTWQEKKCAMYPSINIIMLSPFRRWLSCARSCLITIKSAFNYGGQEHQYTAISACSTSSDSSWVSFRYWCGTQPYVTYTTTSSGPKHSVFRTTCIDRYVVDRYIHRIYLSHVLFECEGGASADWKCIWHFKTDLQSLISLNLGTGQTGHATLFNQWEGAILFTKTSTRCSKIFHNGGGRQKEHCYFIFRLRDADSSRLGFTLFQRNHLI